jgi:hypothetical protein
MRDLFAKSGMLFDRGMPMRVTKQADGVFAATAIDKHSVVALAHRLALPVKLDEEGKAKPVTLPLRVAEMYLSMIGEWNLQPLAGVSTAPLLARDGSVRVVDGYDPTTKLWCCNIPMLTLPERPTDAEAAAALLLIRKTFRTFPFADAVRKTDSALGVDVVDITKSPALDESAFLTMLFTAVCRPSLWLAPAFLGAAPDISGAGTGKGLLVRAICIIAFGDAPRAFTCGAERHELDKRLAAELIEAAPALFLDNANGLALKSDTLASALTERPARVRVLGQTRMVMLNSTAFIALTGNGLTVSEDLARRVILCELDARCEDPEKRPFAAGFLAEIASRRGELLTAVLTVWRWGRQTSLERGLSLGSFEQWCSWCRDPLLALGCRDPVERVATLKARDPKRQHILELFQAWWEYHRDAVVTAAELADPVKDIADPQKRGRQHLARFLQGLGGTRAAGFELIRQESAGKWNPATYQLKNRTLDEPADRTHRTHRSGETPPISPMSPMHTSNRDTDFSPLPTAPETPMSPISPIHTPNQGTDFFAPQSADSSMKSPFCAQCGAADGLVIPHETDAGPVPLHKACRQFYEAARRVRAKAPKSAIAAPPGSSRPDPTEAQIVQWLKQNPISNPIDVCVVCGSGQAPVARRDHHGSHVWTHELCLQTWIDSRFAAARKGLASQHGAHQ